VSATYYVHPTLRTTTDADLRDARTLACVARALGYTGEAGTATGRSGGMELWLRYETGGGRKHVHWSNGNGSSGKGKGNAKGKGKGKSKGTWRGELAEVGLARWWVDHSKREVSAAEDVVGLEDRECFRCIFSKTLIIYIPASRSRHGVSLLGVHGVTPRACGASVCCAPGGDGCADLGMDG
jgi:hypothetical protein